MKCENCNKNKATAFYKSKPVCSKCFKELLVGDRSKRNLTLNKNNKRNQDRNNLCIPEQSCN